MRNAMRRPEVSVVIPTRNRAGLLERTLRAALRQEDVEFEVVVVDDASTDDTTQRVTPLSDGRVGLVRHDERRGTSEARNSGIAAAKGDWIAFLDHDDLWPPHKLRTQLEAADREGATFVYSGAVRVNEELEIVHVDDAVVEPGELLPALLRANAIPGGGSSAMAKASLVDQAGDFDPRLQLLEDWDMWIRLAARGSAAAVQEPLVAYLVYGGNVVLAEPFDLDRELDHLATKHESLMASFGAHVNGMEAYRWVAWTRWRARQRRAALRAYAHGVARYGTWHDTRFALRQAIKGSHEVLTRRPRRVQLQWLQELRS